MMRNMEGIHSNINMQSTTFTVTNKQQYFHLKRKPYMYYYRRHKFSIRSFNYRSIPLASKLYLKYVIICYHTFSIVKEVYWLMCTSNLPSRVLFAVQKTQLQSGQERCLRAHQILRFVPSSGRLCRNSAVLTLRNKLYDHGLRTLYYYYLQKQRISLPSSLNII